MSKQKNRIRKLPQQQQRRKLQRQRPKLQGKNRFFIINAKNITKNLLKHNGWKTTINIKRFFHTTTQISNELGFVCKKNICNFFEQIFFYFTKFQF